MKKGGVYGYCACIDGGNWSKEYKGQGTMRSTQCGRAGPYLGEDDDFNMEGAPGFRKNQGTRGKTAMRDGVGPRGRKGKI